MIVFGVIVAVRIRSNSFASTFPFSRAALAALTAILIVVSSSAICLLTIPVRSRIHYSNGWVRVRTGFVRRDISDEVTSSSVEADSTATKQETINNDIDAEFKSARRNSKR